MLSVFNILRNKKFYGEKRIFIVFYNSGLSIVHGRIVS